MRRRTHVRRRIHVLDERGIQYNNLDLTEMPNKTMTYLRMYCNRSNSIKQGYFISKFRRDLNTF